MHDADPRPSGPQVNGSNSVANLILIFANMIWIFLVIWSTWGIGAVMILGAALNHLITRYEFGLRREEAGINAQDDSDDDPRQPQT